MGVSQVFQIVQMVPNDAKHFIWISWNINLASGFTICVDIHDSS